MDKNYSNDNYNYYSAQTTLLLLSRLLIYLPSFHPIFFNNVAPILVDISIGILVDATTIGTVVTIVAAMWCCFLCCCCFCLGFIDWNWEDDDDKEEEEVTGRRRCCCRLDDEDDDDEDDEVESTKGSMEKPTVGDLFASLPFVNSLVVFIFVLWSVDLFQKIKNRRTHFHKM